MRPHELLTRAQAKSLRCIPAMPTIFAGNGLGPDDAPIAWEQQDQVVQFLLDRRVDAILGDGTTGEAATQEHREQLSFIDWLVSCVSGQVPVIAGCGSNCTREAVNLTRGAMEVGANAGLVVKPYYNKPGASGLVAHFASIAQVGLPFITYSVSGRHGGGAIPIEVIAKLAQEFPHHLGHKEAEGKSQRFTDLRQACPDDFVIWSGDDGITAEVMANGDCDGVISVAANVVPAEVKKMTDLFVQAGGQPTNQATQGFAIHNRLKTLFGSQGLFMQTNPQPVKTALAMMDVIKEACFRLPLVPMEQENPDDVEALRRVLADLDLVEA